MVTHDAGADRGAVGRWPGAHRGDREVVGDRQWRDGARPLGRGLAVGALLVGSVFLITVPLAVVAFCWPCA